MTAPGRGGRRSRLESLVGARVRDLVGDEVRLVVVGINPGLWTAATQTHFAHPSNRFYPALHVAGITDRPLPRGVAHTEDDTRELTDRGIAITNVAPRATARAADLTRDELRRGAETLVERVAAWQPAVVAVAGVTAYRTAFSRPTAVLGPRAERLGGARLWVVPNPSGLNAHETVDSLARWYAQVARAAGVA